MVEHVKEIDPNDVPAQAYHYKPYGKRNLLKKKYVKRNLITINYMEKRVSPDYV